MPLDPDLEYDWEVLPYLEAVTLRKMTTKGRATDHESVHALGRAVMATVLEPGGVITVVKRVTWHLRKSSLPEGVAPDRDDRVVSTSARLAGVYVILSANLESDGTRWRCETQLAREGR